MRMVDIERGALGVELARAHLGWFVCNEGSDGEMTDMGIDIRGAALIPVSRGNGLVLSMVIPVNARCASDADGVEEAAEVVAGTKARDD